jgi:hypothetical protein
MSPLYTLSYNLIDGTVSNDIRGGYDGLMKLGAVVSERARDISLHLWT